MNDRFKFRYFNKYTNKMVEPENWQNVDGIYECIKQQVCFDGNIAPLPYDHIGNGLVFMQCTGLKDKNGKLIYEGDILQCNQMPTKGLCEWFKDGFWVNFFVNGAKRELRNMHNWYEVIGNIYENKELLRDNQ